MGLTLATGRLLGWLAAYAALLFVVSVTAAQAGWLSRLARVGGEAGEVGAKATRIGIVDLERAAAHLRTLPAEARGTALAAHATPEGHWKFVNRDGDVFTAGTPAELQRAVPTLLPQSTLGSRLDIYLGEETVFRDRALLKELPSGARLHLVAGSDAYPLRAVATGGASEVLYAEMRPHLLVELRDGALFNEAVAQLERPLSRSSIRTLALEPGAQPTLSSYPRIDVDSKAALVDAVDPAALAGALTSVRGQTVLVTGRVEDNLLYFRPSSGAEQSIKLSELKRAAADADVNLVLLHAATPNQPGGRNWLWQRIAVGGLDEALKRATLGDFLDALGARHGTFQVGVERDGMGRVAVRAQPDRSMGEPITDMVGGLWSSTVSGLTGNVVTSAVEVHARDEARQQELDLRIVPFVPSWIQFLYVFALAAGILGWPVTSAWFARIWPPEQRSEYRGGLGYRAAQVARFMASLFVFAPLAGFPALLVSLALQAWGVAMLPVKGVRWLLSRGAEVRAG